MNKQGSSAGGSTPSPKAEVKPLIHSGYWGIWNVRDECWMEARTGDLHYYPAKAVAQAHALRLIKEGVGVEAREFIEIEEPAPDGAED